MRKQKVGTGTFFNFEGWDTVVVLTASHSISNLFYTPTFDFN